MTMATENQKHVSMFSLKKPCGNCPFRKVGAIALHPQRLPSIIQTLLDDDWSTFSCHKTVHAKRTGGQWTDDGQYEPSGKESMCVGAMIYLEKVGRPTVPMRLAQSNGTYKPDALKSQHNEIIDPPC